MNNTTSRLAYKRIVESGELARRQEEILQLLFDNPLGLTTWEMARRLIRPINSITPRMAELQRVLVPPADIPLIVKSGVRMGPQGRFNVIWRINPLVKAYRQSANQEVKV